jgi:hypothetical protein
VTPGARRRWRRAPLIIATALALLVALSLAGLRLWLTDERVARLVESTAAGLLSGELRVSSATVYLPATLEARGVRLLGPDGEAALSVGTLKVELSLWALLAHRITLRLVTARDVAIDLRPTKPSGLPAIARAVKRPPSLQEKGKPWALRLDELEVSNVRAELGVASGPRQISVDTIEARHAAYDPESGFASLDALEVSAQDSRAQVSGELVGLERSARVRATAEASLELKDLTSWVPGLEAARLTGPVHLAINARSDRDGLRADASVEGRDLSAYGISVESLACQGRLAAGRVRLAACTLRPRAGGALHAAGTIDIEGSAHDLDLVVDDLPLGELARGLIPDATLVPERLLGRIHVGPPSREGALGRAEMALEAQGLPSHAAPFLAASARLVGSLEFTRSSVEALAFEAQSGSLAARLTGSLSFEKDGPLDIDVSASDTRPSWVSSLAADMTPGVLELEAKLRGALANPQAQGRITASGWRWRGSVPLAARLSWRFTQTRLLVEEALVTGAPGSVRGSGALELGVMRNLRAMPVRADLEAQLDLDKLGIASLRGQLRARAALTGRLGSPHGEVTAEAASLSLAGVALHDLRLELAARGDALSGHARIGLGGGSVAVQGEAVLPSSELRIALNAADCPLEELRQAVGHDIAGRLDGRLTANGSWASPQTAGRFSIVGARLAGVALGKVTLSASGRLPSFDGRLEVNGPSGAFALAGSVEVQKRRVVVEARGSEITAGPLLAAFGLRHDDARLNLDVKARGELPYPEVLDVSAMATHLVIDGKALSVPLVARAHGTPSGYEGELALGGILASTIRARRGPPFTVEGHASLDNVELQELLPNLGELGVGVTTSARVHVSFTAPRDLRASGSISALEVRAGGETAHLTAPVQVSYAAGELRLARLHMVGPHGIDFSVEGSADEELDARFDGQLDTGLIAAFAPSLGRVEGIVRVQGRASGALTSPRVTGEVSLATPVVIRPRALARELRLEQGRITAESSSGGTSVTADLRGSLDGSAVVLQGNALIAGLELRHYDLHLTGQNLAVRSHELVVDANPDIRLTGNASRALVAGRIDIIRGRYLKKFELKDFKFVAREAEVSRPLSAEAPWLGRVDLDVKVTSQSGVELRVDAGVASMQLQLSADVHATGTVLQPRLDGRIESSSGTLEFPQAKLNVSQAVVEFTPQRQTPDIDLRADGEVTPPTSSTGVASPTYFVQLRLSGNLDNVALELTSTPELNRLEVLALLVRGEANLSLIANRQGASDSSTLDAALAFAGSQLSAPLSQFLTQQLERTLNLKLQVGAELTSSGVRVTASQQLTPRLRLQGAYERSIGTPGALASASASLLVTNRLYLEGSTQSGNATNTDLTGESTESRLELKWRLLGL